MKKIYNKLLSLTSSSNKKIISNFIIDLDKLSDIALYDKYDMYYESNSVVHRAARLVLKESFFNIHLTENNIFFEIKNNLSYPNFFSAEFCFSIKNKIYSTNFGIYNSGNEWDYLKVDYEFNKKSIMSIFTTGEEAKDNNFLLNDNVMNIIFDNYLQPNDLHDLLLLSEDLNIENNEIFSCIISQAKLLSSHLNNKKIKPKL